MKRKWFPVAAFCAALLTGQPSPAQDLTILTTGDIHGKWFDSTFVEGKVRASLLAVSQYVKDVRMENGDDKVLLVDIGGQLDGPDAAFYWNHVRKDGHLLPHLADYVGYDAMLRNETVPDEALDRVAKGLKKARIPYIGPSRCRIIKKAGLRIAIFGVSDQAYISKTIARKKPDLYLYPDEGKAVAVHGKDSVTVEMRRNARSVGRIRLTSSGMTAESTSIRPDVTDETMRERFKGEYEEIKAFVNSPLCLLTEDLPAREAYKGQSRYMDFYHALGLSAEGADLSLSALLSIDGTLGAGPVTYGDIARLYPFENTLVLLSLTGDEIKKCLEMSYSLWIQTPGDHVLLTRESRDYKNGGMKTGFAKSPANFVSAGGIVYTVDLEEPYGKRVEITSFADGSPFMDDHRYNVAVTNYFASGAGGILGAAGLDTKEKIAERTVRKGPAFRNLLYFYIRQHGDLDPAVFGDPAIVGRWSFIPECSGLIDQDLRSIFGPDYFK